jgi:uncharacterized integral membrane protein
MRLVARVLYWMVAIIAAAAIIVFCVVNRAAVIVSFKPLPWAPELPLFVVVMGTFAVGALIGGLLAWAGGHGTRRLSRERKRRIRGLEKELAAAEQKAAEQKAAARAAAALPPASPPSRDAA